MLQTFLSIIHVIVCLFLVLVVLLQQGRGGGMGSAFGGATAQVFGGRGAGNFLTRLTGICAAIFMLTSVSLAYLASSGDRMMKQAEKEQAAEKERLEKERQDKQKADEKKAEEKKPDEKKPDEKPEEKK